MYFPNFCSVTLTPDDGSDVWYVDQLGVWTQDSRDAGVFTESQATKILADRWGFFPSITTSSPPKTGRLEIVCAAVTSVKDKDAPVEFVTNNYGGKLNVRPSAVTAVHMGTSTQTYIYSSGSYFIVEEAYEQVNRKLGFAVP